MPVVTSNTELCNIALSMLGSDEISDLSDESKEGYLCNRHYSRVRDAVLRAHQWNFAVTRVDLAEDATDPVFEYTYRFALPTDCLRVIRTESDSLGYTPNYRIEGRYVYTDDSTCAIEYIKQVTDVTVYDALFVDVLTARLAAELAYALTDNATLASNMRALYEEKLREARNVDAQEGAPREAMGSNWLDARV